MSGIKARTIVVLILFQNLFTLTLNSQNIAAQRQLVNENYVPKKVVETFKSQYKTILLKGWYVTHLVYWQNDYSSDWYQGWYHQRTVTIYTYEKPNYYEVEFSAQPGELSRAIYNKYGYWYETRTQIKGLPMAIYDTLNETQYKDWKISKVMEKLESPDWPEIIFRFHVSKGMKSEILRMDSKGNFIQIKHLD